MEKLLTGSHLVRMARHKRPIALAVLLVFGGLAVWAILQTPSTLTAIAWGGMAVLPAALVYLMLDAAQRLHAQAADRAEMKRHLDTLAESNAALKAARQELAQQKALAENLLAVARAVNQQPILESMLQNVLDITATLTGAANGSLFLFDPQGRISQSLFTRQSAPLKPSQSVIELILQNGLAGWAIRNRQTARCQDTRSDLRWIERPDQPSPVRSAIAVPFISRGAVIGVLTLTHAEPNHFTEAHEKLLGGAADQIAISLDNAKMFDTMMRMADRMGLLYTLSKIATGADLSGVLSQSVRAMRQATRWSDLAVLLLDESRRMLVARASLGNALPGELSPDEALVSSAWHTCEAGIVESSIWGTVLVAPISAERRPYGVLLVKGGADMEDVELLSAAADILASAIINAELRRKLERGQGPRP